MNAGKSFLEVLHKDADGQIAEIHLLIMYNART